MFKWLKKKGKREETPTPDVRTSRRLSISPQKKLKENTQARRNAELIECAMKADPKALKKLLGRSADANVQNEMGYSALQLAIMASKASRTDTKQFHANWQECVKLLVAADANVNFNSLTGQSVLELAISARDESMAYILIEEGADVNARTASGQSLIYLAAQRGLKDTVNAMVSKGARLKDALEQAQPGSETQKILKEAQETPNRYLGRAIERRSFKGILELLQQGAEFSADFLESDGAVDLLRLAIDNDQAAVVAALIDAGLSVDSAKGLVRPPLCRAAYKGHVSTVSMLLEKKASVDAVNGYSALHWAFEDEAPAIRFSQSLGVLPDDHPDVVRISDPDRTKRLLEFKLDIAGQLLSAKADVNARSPQDETPLSVAARWGQLRAVKLLLEAKAEVDTCTKRFEGRHQGEWKLFGAMTPLHFACENGSMPLVNALVDAKADPQIFDAEGRLPAQLFAESAAMESWRSCHVSLLDRFNS